MGILFSCFKGSSRPSKSSATAVPQCDLKPRIDLDNHHQPHQAPRHDPDHHQEHNNLHKSDDTKSTANRESGHNDIDDDDDHDQTDHAPIDHQTDHLVGHHPDDHDQKESRAGVNDHDDHNVIHK
ncbi:hypothetical protein TorRG33x02_111450 [Trema orientale]|uniref:Uncharacterized protein n=1 Tax=Trema orientale TaxID=63057 RepID=A0A2P5F650_TREOI|nr:hypothetical protein TorRG33x02_111450 [Trema orientale]